MPNRIIKESICSSDSIKPLSWFEEVFFYRLIVNADDYGRLDGRTEMLQAKLFPLRRDITSNTVEKALNALTAAGMVLTYSFDGRPFLQLTAWEKHQQVRSKKSKYPAPDSNSNQLISSDINCNQMISDDINGNQLQSDVTVIQSESLSKSLSESNSGSAKLSQKKLTPPTLDDIKKYCQEVRKNDVDPVKFFDYFEASNWIDSNGKRVRNWKQKIITWEGRRNETGQYATKRDITPDDPKYGTLL